MKSSLTGSPDRRKKCNTTHCSALFSNTREHGCHGNSAVQPHQKMCNRYVHNVDVWQVNNREMETYLSAVFGHITGTSF